MMKEIVVFVLVCYLQQNNAFVIPANSGIAGFEAESSVSDHQLDKKSPQSFFPDFPFDTTPNVNDGPFPVNLPQFGMQFATNGIQTGLSTGYDIPFQSGNIIDPGGKGFRDLGQDMFNQPLPPNGVVTGTMQPMNQYANQPLAFKTETFNVDSPNGQQLFENNKLVETLPNPNQMQTSNTRPQDTTMQTPNLQQSSTPQVQTGTGPQLTSGNVGQGQQPVNPLMQSTQASSNPNSALPIQPPNYPSLQTQSSTNPGLQGQQAGSSTPSNPNVKMTSAGASSSTFISSTNNQPPQMAQSADAYNFNYDSNQPTPLNGNYLAVNGYTPNMNDPSQGNYQYTHGSFPTQQGSLPMQQGSLPMQQGSLPMQQGSLPLQQNTGLPQNSLQFNQGVNPNPALSNQQTVAGYNSPMFTPGNANYKAGGRQNQQSLSHQPPLNSYQYNPPQYGNSGHFTNMIPNQIQQHIGRLNNQLSSLGMPHVNPSAVIAPISQFIQTFPQLIRNAANQGLQISKMPFDMLNAALDAFNTDLSNVRVNEFIQIPTEGGRALVNTIEEMINQFQRNLQTFQSPALARRSPEPWMLPNFDMNQMSQYYNSIPFGTAQEKINNMKNEILSKMQSSNLNQMNQPFNYFSKPQIPQMPQMQQMPQMTQSSSNGEPVVKVYSSSVAESTHSSSVNGGPPEVSHKAAGYNYNYDSTKTDNPVESDLVAMQGYTPDASDPNQGTYVAYENTYP